MKLIISEGTADLKATFYPKGQEIVTNYILHVNTIQMIVLMLFNEQNYLSLEVWIVLNLFNFIKSYFCRLFKMKQKFHWNIFLVSFHHYHVVKKINKFLKENLYEKIGRKCLEWMNIFLHSNNLLKFHLVSCQLKTKLNSLIAYFYSWSS